MKSAALIGDLEEQVYVTQPECLMKGGHVHKLVVKGVEPLTGRTSATQLVAVRLLRWGENSPTAGLREERRIGSGTSCLPIPSAVTAYI